MLSGCEKFLCQLFNFGFTSAKALIEVALKKLKGHQGVEKLLPTQGCIIEHLLDFEWRIKGTSCAVRVIQHCYLCNAAQFCALQMKNTIAWTVCAVRVIKHSVWGLEAPYNTWLRLVLYGPLDPTLCALLLIQHSCPCFNIALTYCMHTYKPVYGCRT